MKLKLLLLSRLLLGAPLIGAAGISNVVAKFQPIPPFSTLVAAANARQIPIDSIDPLADNDTLNPGDSVTALLTLFEKGGRRTQWILFLQALPNDGPEPLPNPRGPMTLYSSRGTKVEFVSSLAFGSLRTLGPFADANKKQPKLNDHTDRFVLDKGFLALGFDKSAATILRIRDSKIKGDFNFRPTPFSETDIARGRALAEAVHLTDDEERALAAGVPALISYFSLLEHAEGLEDIAMKVVARPSIWSIVRHVGVTATILFRPDKIEKAATRGIGVAAAKSVSGVEDPQPRPAYYIPLEMQLNKQPALYTTLIVDTPRPPLLLCGGVVGLLAEKPGDNETYLTLRVISARRAAQQ